MCYIPTVFCQPADVSFTRVCCVQCQCDSWSKRRSHDDDRNAYCFWYLLCWLWIHCWMEICKIRENYFLVLCVLPSIWILWTSSLGSRTWEEPEVQGRKVYSGEVMTNIFCHVFFFLCLVLFILYIQMTWLMVCKCLPVLVMPKAAFDFIVSLEFTGINFYCEQVQGGRPRRKPVLDCTWCSFGRKWCRRYMKRDWASSSMLVIPCK